MGWESVAMMAGSAILANQNKPSGIKAPAKRSYLGEMQAALAAQSQIQPQLMALESYYQPLWQEQNKNMLTSQMRQMQDLYGQAQGFSQRISNQSIDTASPLYQRIGQTAMKSYEGMLGDSAGLMSTLENQAAQDLAAGKGLTAEEQRYAQQAARAALNARGIQQGNYAVASEVLNDYNLSNAREMQRRAFAGSVISGRAALANAAYQSYGQPLMQQAQALSPAGIIAQSQAMGQGLGAKIFNQESQYNADVMGSNNANIMNTNLANAQMGAGYSAGMMSMLGSIGAAALKKA